MAATNSMRKLFNLANRAPVLRSGVALKGEGARNGISCMRRKYDLTRTMATAGQEMTPDYRDSTGERRRGGDAELSRRGGQFSPLRGAGAFDALFPYNQNLLSMIETMDRLFDDTFSRPALAGVSLPYPNTSRLPFDFKETDDSYRVRVDLPGFSKDDVKVYVENGGLVIKGEHKDEEKSEDEWTSRSYGSYSTRILLPENTNTAQIKAEMKNGVLFVRVPKASEPQPSVINVSIE